MKKTLSVFLSASLLVGSLAVDAQIVQGASDAVQVQSTKSSSVLRLTMDDVVNQAVSTDRNLVILGYQYEMLRLQKKSIEDNIDKTTVQPIDGNAIRDGILKNLNIDYDKADDDTKKLIDYLVNMQLAELSGVNTQIEEQRKKLEESLEQIKVEELKSLFQTDEAREGIRYMMKARFIELVGLQEGLKLQRSHFNSLTADVRKAELEKDLGLISADSARKIFRDFSKQDRSLKEKENEYKLAVSKLALDLGYSSDQQIELVSSFSRYPSKITQTQSTDQLIANSYKIQNFNRDIDQKSKERDKLSGNEREIKQQEVNILIEQRRQAEINLKKQIASLYAKADNAYAEWEEKRLDTYDVNEDERKFTLQYELGLISKHDYEKTTLPMKQANFEELMARMSYFLIEEEIKALEKGVVLTQ